MNVFVVTAGSRGDGQPYVALGRGLRAAGHTVTVCTCSSIQSFITEHGLNYGYMNDGFIKLVDSEASRETMESGSSAFGLIKSMVTLMREAKALNREMMKDAWSGAGTTDSSILHQAKALGERLRDEDGMGNAIAIIECIV